LNNSIFQIKRNSNYNPQCDSRCYCHVGTGFTPVPKHFGGINHEGKNNRRWSGFSRSNSSESNTALSRGRYYNNRQQNANNRSMEKMESGQK